MTRVLLVHDDLVILLESEFTPAALEVAVKCGTWAPPPQMGLEGLPLRAVRLGRVVIISPVEPGAPPSDSPNDGQPADCNLVRLSERQRQVLQGLADGLTHRQIAARLKLNERTVDLHVEAIKRRFGTRSRMQSVLRGATLGLCKIRR